MDVYADNGATTRLSREAYKEMCRVAREVYGNPSSLHNIGRIANNEIENARITIANILKCKPSEIVFTSGGTESNNLAIMNSVMDSLERFRRPHVITTMIEHPSVYNMFKKLESIIDVDYIYPDEYGHIYLDQIEDAMRDNTTFICVMFANNEIGSINDIEYIGKFCERNNLLFHTDAVQVVGHLPINLNKYYITSLSASAHKFGGMKGSGFLYIRDGCLSKFATMIGGEQEKERRAGTENVIGIASMAKALNECDKYMEMNYDYILELNHLIKKSFEEIPDITINSDFWTLPSHINITIKDVDSSTMLTLLDLNGICASSGSACTSDSVEPSRILKAIGLSDSEANNTIRITINQDNTKQEIIYLIKCVNDIINFIKRKER